MAASAPAPVAFRAGNYGANDDTLRALAMLGITHDSSHCPALVGGACQISLGSDDRDPVLHHRIIEVPAGTIGTLGGGQDYRRHYIDMGQNFEAYLARFSGKTRSTLRRKAKKLAEDCDGTTVTEHRTPQEIEAFLAAALPLSACTYQARLLDAGLPGSREARRAMLEAAEDDRMRGFLLWAGGKAIAYLSLPVVGATLVYAHLGYDPDHARLSPGTVLQMEALERLFAEQRYRWFDFTKGEGARKVMFGTGSAQWSSFVLLHPTLANRALLGARGAFDVSVAGARTLAERPGALARIRAGLRA